MPRASRPARAGLLGGWRCCGHRGWARRAVAPAHPSSTSSLGAAILAKISSEKVVPTAQTLLTLKNDPYESKQIKMFKGFEKSMILSIFIRLGFLPSVGWKLEANSQKQYLLNWSDPQWWESLCPCVQLHWGLGKPVPSAERESLNHHYHLNCGCQITTCYTVPCTISAPNEWLWTDWLLERKLTGAEAQHYVCMSMLMAPVAGTRDACPQEGVCWHHPALGWIATTLWESRRPSPSFLAGRVAVPTCFRDARQGEVPGGRCGWHEGRDGACGSLCPGPQSRTCWAKG